MAGTAGRAELLQLLADRRYEEALDILRLARQKAPDVPEIARGIQLLKQRLLRRYLHQLGDLDRVPKLTVDLDSDQGDDLLEEERELLRLIDGVSSYGDIVLESRFGRFDTYRMMASLAARGVVRSSDGLDHDQTGFTPEPELVEEEYEVVTERTPEPVSIAKPETPSSVPTMTPEPPPPSSRAMRKTDDLRPPRSRAVAWVGACIGVTALAAGGAWAMGLTDALFGTHPARVMVAAAPPRPAPSRLTEFTPPPPVAAPSPVAAPPPSAAVVADPPPPAATEAAAPMPTPVAAEPAPADIVPAPSSPPVPPHPTTEAAHRAAPPPVHHVIATPPVDTPAPASPSHEVVEEALERIEPAFRVCTEQSAARVGKTPPERIQVSLTIDQSGLARDLDSSVGRLPGLMDCLRDKSGRIRRGEAPADLGAVRVSFTLSLPGTPPPAETGATPTESDGEPK